MKCDDDVNDGIEGVITRSREDDRRRSRAQQAMPYAKFFPTRNLSYSRFVRNGFVISGLVLSRIDP